MDLKKVGIVISHEYSTRVQKKSFILITILTPLLMGLLIVVPVLIALWGGNEKQTVRILDHSGFVMPYFENSENVTYEKATEGESMDAIRAAFKELASMPRSRYPNRIHPAMSRWTPTPRSRSIWTSRPPSARMSTRR